MPSETIYSQQGRVDVRVAWGTNQSGQVQVATLAATTESQDSLDRLFALINEWLKEADMPQLDATELRKRLKYTPMFDGWHASLSDWSEVNRLIKVLKRARDNSFGAPE